MYNTFIILLYSLVPFSINLIAAILLVMIVAHNRFKLRPEQSFSEHIHDQLQQHKHILIAPYLLILLSLPRLIISFTSGCMKSPRQSLLYLIAYFLSYILAMLMFLVSILLSKTYKSEFNKIVQQWIKRFHRRF